MSRNDDDNNNNHEDKSRGRFHEDHFRHVHDHFFTHIFQHFHPFANFNHVGSNRQQPPLPPDVRFGVGGGGCGGESDDVLSSLHSIWSGDLHHVFANMDNLLKQFSFFDDDPQMSPPLAQITDGQVNPITPANAHMRDMFFKRDSPPAISSSAPQLPFDTNVLDSRPPPRSFLSSFFDFSPNLSGNLDMRQSSGKSIPFDQDPTDNTKEPGPASLMNKNNFPSIHSYGQSVSVRRVVRPDGSVEEIRTVRNSDGKEEKTVTRIINDKKHSVIEKKQNDVVQETEELFENFNEKELGDFNKTWYAPFENAGKAQYGTRPSQPADNTEKPLTSLSSLLTKIYSWIR